jgi:hypothetical protein
MKMSQFVFSIEAIVTGRNLNHNKIKGLACAECYITIEKNYIIHT